MCNQCFSWREIFKADVHPNKFQGRECGPLRHWSSVAIRLQFSIHNQHYKTSFGSFDFPVICTKILMNFNCWGIIAIYDHRLSIFKEDKE